MHFEPYAAKRSQGFLTCVKCGCYSSARTCWHCSTMKSVQSIEPLLRRAEKALRYAASAGLLSEDCRSSSSAIEAEATEELATKLADEIKNLLNE